MLPPSPATERRLEASCREHGGKLLAGGCPAERRIGTCALEPTGDAPTLFAAMIAYGTDGASAARNEGHLDDLKVLCDAGKGTLTTH